MSSAPLGAGAAGAAAATGAAACAARGVAATNGATADPASPASPNPVAMRVIESSPFDRDGSTTAPKMRLASGSTRS
jgi:hypothetical protein